MIARECLKKRGQEEMVGFALIMIIVAVILLIFLSFSLSNSEKEIVESYEVSSFIQSFLQYTTDCMYNAEYASLQEMIFYCEDAKKCIDERKTCEVLNQTLNEILEESWKVEEDRPLKGYFLRIDSNSENILSIKKGNQSGDSKGSMQDFSKKGKNYGLYFEIYY